MKELIIDQKMSGTGNIHDIASDMFDRVIKFREGTKYAVILASYYGGDGYTTHKTAEAAARKSKQLEDYSHVIMDLQGTEYVVDWNGELSESN